MSQSATDTDSTESRVSRRRVVQVAGATITAPSLVNVATADTDSGHVELETTATVPTDTTVEITVFEDTTGDGTADTQQTKTIPDGTTTTEYEMLEAITNASTEMWLLLELSTTATEVTPSVDSATLTLPDEMVTPTEPPETPMPQPDEPQSPGEIWQNYQAFVAFIVLAFTAIGAWSKSIAVGIFAGYMAFLYIALNSGSVLFENIAYVTLILVFLGFAFKLIRLEFEGEA